MKAFFRLLLVVAVAGAVITLFLPLQPQPVSVALDQPPPAWLIGGFLGLLAGPLLLVSSIGLFAFRRWSRPLSKVATLLATIAAILFLSGIPLLSLAPPLTNAVLALSAIAWFGALVVSHHKQIAPQFQAER